MHVTSSTPGSLTKQTDSLSQLNFLFFSFQVMEPSVSRTTPVTVTQRLTTPLSSPACPSNLRTRCCRQTTSVAVCLLQFVSSLFPFNWLTVWVSLLSQHSQTSFCHHLSTETSKASAQHKCVVWLMTVLRRDNWRKQTARCLRSSIRKSDIRRRTNRTSYYIRFWFVPFCMSTNLKKIMTFF